MLQFTSRTTKNKGGVPPAIITKQQNFNAGIAIQMAFANGPHPTVDDASNVSFHPIALILACTTD